MKSKAILVAAACVLMLGACQKPAGWSVSGTIENASDSRLALEALTTNGSWYVVDSLDTDAKGRFSYTSPRPAAYPEILRLTLDGASVYFPVDSVDRIEIKADAADFAGNYTLGGTESAVQMRRVDSLITVRAQLGDSLLKRQLTQEILSDPTGVVAYYIINKSVGGQPLFDTNNRFDNRIYGAVAQRFMTLRPDDPRTAMLQAIYMRGKSAINPVAPTVTQIEAPETGLIDIELYDNRGQLHRLSEVAGKGKPVILSFTTYEMGNSPAYNVLLNDAYSRYAQSGLQIYQVAFDTDEVAWKETAVNLPWITLLSSPSTTADVVMKYNVDMLPLTYIIDGNGDIRKRLEDPTQIVAEIGRFF